MTASHNHCTSQTLYSDLCTRWYDPITGRWLSKDPIGISGGLNQYVFCANNPVMYTDPLGLCEEGQWIDVGEGVSMWITGDLNRFARAHLGSRTISRTRLEPTLEPEPESEMIEFDILGIIMPTHVAPARRQYVTGSLEGDLRFHRANSFPRELATRGLGVQTTVIGIHQSVQSGAPLLFKVAVGGTRFGFQRAVLHNQANVNDRE